jgi:hypothetical protein
MNTTSTRFAIALAMVAIVAAPAAAKNKPAAAPATDAPAPPAKAEACVGNLTPLVAVPIVDGDRAMDQEEECRAIIKNTAGAKEDPAKKTCIGFAAALAFCQDPLTATAVTSQDLLTARKWADQGCSPPATNSHAESTIPLSLQDELIRGLADFVVARAKAEAMAFLIGRLRDNVCSNADARALLVHSCALLDAVNPNDGAPPAWGTIKSAFEADLHVLPERAVACVAHDAPEDARDTLVTGVQAIELVRDGNSPIDVANGLVDRFPKDQCKTSTDLRCGLHMLGFAVRVLSPSLDPSADGAPKTASDVVKMGQIAARRILDEAVALGLESADDEKALQKDAARLEALAAKLDALRVRLLALIESVRAARTAIKGGKADPVKSGLQLAHSLVDLMDAAFALAPADLTDGVKTHVHAYLAAIDELVQSIGGAVQNDYASVLVYVTGAVAALVEAKLANKLPADFAKYGPFIADVASAKSADDVQHALESAAAPVGASLAKRGAGHRGMAITAFVGVQGGWEVTSLSNGDDVWAKQISLYAPVGVDATWGFCKDSSIGVFVQAIDLGALASLRFHSDSVTPSGSIPVGSTVEDAPQVGFRQVFSPGLYLVYGWDRASFGIGGSVTPELREVTQDGMLVEHASAVRVGAFLAIDVTLFPF